MPTVKILALGRLNFLSVIVGGGIADTLMLAAAGLE